MPVQGLRIPLSGLTQITEEAEPTVTQHEEESEEPSLAPRRVGFNGYDLPRRGSVNGSGPDLNVRRSSTDLSRRGSIGGGVLSSNASGSNSDVGGGSRRGSLVKGVGNTVMNPTAIPMIPDLSASYSSPSSPPTKHTSNDTSSQTTTPPRRARVTFSDFPERPESSSSSFGNSRAQTASFSDEQNVERVERNTSGSPKSDTPTTKVTIESVAMKPTEDPNKIKKKERMKRIRELHASKKMEMPGPGAYNPYTGKWLRENEAATDLWTRSKSSRLKEVEKVIIGPGKYDVSLHESHVKDLASTVFRSRAERFKSQVQKDQVNTLGPGSYDMFVVKVKTKQVPWIASIHSTLDRVLEGSVKVRVVPPAQTMNEKIEQVERYFDKIKVRHSTTLSKTMTDPTTNLVESKIPEPAPKPTNPYITFVKKIQG